MKRSSIKTFFLAGMAAMFCVATAWGAHGRLETTDRDAWINDLAAPLAEASAQDVARMSNLEMAQLTYDVAGIVIAQAKQRQILDAPPDKKTPTPEVQKRPAPTNIKTVAPALQKTAAPADQTITMPPDQNKVVPPVQRTTEPPVRKTVSLEGLDPALVKLVEEFRRELSAMGLDLNEWDERLVEIQLQTREMGVLQREYLKKTGTGVSGMMRGYFNMYRGFGAASVYPAMAYNAFGFTEVRLKSVPAPFVLFDARMRLTRSFGFTYEDPISPTYELRWIQLSALPEAGGFTAGDFYKSYTPLTLWNSEIPVYSLLEPASFKRTRKDVEDLVYMDQGPHWHLRGLQAYTNPVMPANPILKSLDLQAMAGQIGPGTPSSYGSYFAGGQGSLFFAQGEGFVTATGLLLWDDPDTTGFSYVPGFPPTQARDYQLASVKPGLEIPFTTDVKLSASAEYAGAAYEDNRNNPDLKFRDWALLVNAGLDAFMVKARFKFLDVGPFFYSPGAQISRYSPYVGTLRNYLSADLNRDEALKGYLNNFVFQGVSQPFFAFYDRLEENIFPYGDATPNRQGCRGTLSADLGEGGWLKPQASFTRAEEIQANDVMGPDGSPYSVEFNVLDHDSPLRTFTGMEGALTVDFAKGLDEKGKTYSLGLDYKRQETTWDMDLSPFEVNTFIAAVDFSVPVKAFSSVVISAAVEHTFSKGEEFVYKIGDYSTFTTYPFYMNSAALGAFDYTFLNLSKTTWAWGLMYPLSKTIRFKADWFITSFSWTDHPEYDRRDQVMRFTYEASF
jgi:hypothetical protein